MYKKFFMGIAAMAALTLVSCSSDDLNSLSGTPSKNEAISFDSYLGRSAVSVNGSRGSVLDMTALQGLTEGFGVFGNYSSTGSTTVYGENLFKNEQVTYSTRSTSTNTNWTYTNTKYWPTEGHIDFLAYAPYDSKQLLKDNQKLDFTVNSIVKDQQDLLWANADNKTKDDNPVKFTFNHALAKIGYSLKQKETYSSSSTTITVTSIKLVGSETTNAFYTVGTIDLAKPNKDENLWAIADDVKKQNFDWFNGGAVLTTDAADNNAADKNLFVIPQDFSATNKLFVVVEYTVQTDGTAELKNKVSKQITTKFKQGMAYMINLTLGLTPIEFDASVEKWTDFNQKDIDAWN